MIELGVLGLDTSHAEAFTEYIETHTDATVSMVWDGRTVRDDEYVRQFCDTYGAESVSRPERMIETIDGAMVLTVNWEEHVDLAVPFLEAGIPVLIDKPVAGSLDAINELAAPARKARLFGGSALPYHPSVSQLPREVPDRSLFCAGYGNQFYYGAHIIDVARTVAGAPWTRVAPCAGSSKAVEVEFGSECVAVLRFDGPDENPAFGVLDASNAVHTARIGKSETALNRMYPPYLDAFLKVVREERYVTDFLLDSARLLLAATAAIENEQMVTPMSETLCEIEVDADAFLAEYEPY